MMDIVSYGVQMNTIKYNMNYKEYHKLRDML